MAQIYFDNAANAPLLPEVLDTMRPYLGAAGNASAIHRHGRTLRVAVEQARRSISDTLGASPSEVFFTSGGTESNNWALKGAVTGLGVKEVISSALEHASVREVLRELASQGRIRLSLVPHDKHGRLKIERIEDILAQSKRPVLISLMHANNEIGNLLDLSAFRTLIGEDVYFHSDMVQSAGHLPIVLEDLPVHMATISAHKLHGPRGVGALYVRQGCLLAPLLQGGGQERNMRAGTENVAAIVGMGAAMRLCRLHMEANQLHISSLKRKFITDLRKNLPDLHFNGQSEEDAESLSSILSLSLPAVIDQESLLMRLDMEGISLSVGSACASGSIVPSAVLSALDPHSRRVSVRISLSKLNTKEEISRCVEVISAAMRKSSRPLKSSLA